MKHNNPIRRKYYGRIIVQTIEDEKRLKKWMNRVDENEYGYLGDDEDANDRRRPSTVKIEKRFIVSVERLKEAGIDLQKIPAIYTHKFEFCKDAIRIFCFQNDIKCLIFDDMGEYDQINIDPVYEYPAHSRYDENGNEWPDWKPED